MRLVKIKNKYLYKGNNPEGTHTYAVYYDRKTKRNRAVGLTHLYVKDNKRFEAVKKGKIAIEKFKNFETPSGVKNSFYDKNVNGGKIDLKDSAHVVYVSKRYLPSKQASRIRNFAKRRER
jgi:hypothetical protein